MTSRYPRDPGGPFAPGQVLWTVDRETALLLGAGRALLLQLAHPLVAAGVAEHSRFAEDPLGRLLRTLETSYAIVFGDVEAAHRAVRRMDAVHGRVQGVLPERVGPFPAGTPYDAMNPTLRLWVHATLVETSLVVYTRFVARLSPAEQARYYGESRALARIQGIPDPLIPASLEAFRAYVTRTLATEIAVGASARALARLIFRPAGALSLRAIGPLAEFVTAGLLPPDVRRQYGYRWSPMRERALGAVARAIRMALPAVPAVIRVAPPARAAERRRRREAAGYAAGLGGPRV